MSDDTTEIEALIELMARLPGLGPRSARRAVLHMIKKRGLLMGPLAEAMADVAAHARECSVCGNVGTDDICGVCRAENRANGQICVVEDVADLWAMERGGVFGGRYHVLGGVLSALDAVGPEDLRIRELVARISGRSASSSATGSEAQDASDGEHQTVGGAEPPHDTEPSDDDHTAITEVILAVNPNVEGDTTAYYISRLLEPFDVRISRLAQGMPLGGDLEFTDEATLTRALEGRVSV